MKETKAAQLPKQESVVEVKKQASTAKLTGSEIVKDFDGNVYTTVEIGNQVWTVENLKTTKYNDGTPIPLITGQSEWKNCKSPAYCFYDNDNSNKDKYGALYNWHAVNTGKIAPKGWHLPTDEDWTELEEYLIANGYNWDGTREENWIAKSMAAKTDWETDSALGTIGNVLSMNNRCGFSALPGGMCDTLGKFNYAGSAGFWWMATENDANNVWFRYMSFNLSMVRKLNNDSKELGFSVRCVRD